MCGAFASILCSFQFNCIQQKQKSYALKIHVLILTLFRKFTFFFIATVDTTAGQNTSHLTAVSPQSWVHSLLKWEGVKMSLGQYPFPGHDSYYFSTKMTNCTKITCTIPPAFQIGTELSIYMGPIWDLYGECNWAPQGSHMGCHMLIQYDLKIYIVKVN